LLDVNARDAAYAEVFFTTCFIFILFSGRLLSVMLSLRQSRVVHFRSRGLVDEGLACGQLPPDTATVSEIYEAHVFSPSFAI
jgi:hypothetical protein